jgi:23S rRNA (guanosine2251-2'-O)-methyltransferase
MLQTSLDICWSFLHPAFPCQPKLTRLSLHLTKTTVLRYETVNMIKLHHFSRDKFQGFDEEQQTKALLQLLCALESNIAYPEHRQALLPSILECFHWSTAGVQEQFTGLSHLADITSPHDIQKLIIPIIRARKQNYNENDSEILRYDGTSDQSGVSVPYPVTVILDNLRSAYNVGSIFRTAECVGAKSIYLCGITPTPPHPKLSKTAMGTDTRLAWQHFSDTADAILTLKKQGIPVIALETTSDAKPLYEYQATQPVAMLMGNEALGIEEKILALADEILYIPMHGWKNSLNVCNAFSLAAYRLSGI